MRGVGRGGRSFKPPQNQRRGIELADIVENLPGFSELTDAPKLEPINDEWSISDPFEPVDPRDCAKYPASPYCEDDLFRFGPPVGFDVEIRINGCTICVYIYPVVGWMRLTPTIICRRDPNCAEDNPPPPPKRYFDPPPRLEENVKPDRYKSPDCAFRESMINRNLNIHNAAATQRLKELQEEFSKSSYPFNVTTESYTNKLTSNIYSQEQIDSGCFTNLREREYVIDDQGRAVLGQFVNYKYGDTRKSTEVFFSLEGANYSRSTFFLEWEPVKCCGMPFKPPIAKRQPPPPLPPPFGKDDDRKKGGNGKKGGKDCMCCNDCRDSKDNTDKLLKEIKEIKKVLGSGKLQQALNAAVGIGDDSITGILDRVYKRIGVDRYPIEVPESLLTGVGDKTQNVQSMTDYLYWLTHQVDALVGEFPIKIEVQDIDPLTPGPQPKTLVIDNIAEAIAETYALTLKSAINQEVELNILFRLAGEIIATKNCAAITQDYVKANATFLGYKGNQVSRQLTYNFDLTPDTAENARPDGPYNEVILPAADTLELMLKTTTGYVQGWEIKDKETVVGFLQKLMFAAGIIKSVFFRGKKRLNTFNDELTRMANDAKGSEANWEKFVKDIENPNSDFNKDSIEKPDIKEIRKEPPNPKGK